MIQQHDLLYDRPVRDPPPKKSATLYVCHILTDEPFQTKTPQFTYSVEQSTQTAVDQGQLQFRRWDELSLSCVECVASILGRFEIFAIRQLHDFLGLLTSTVDFHRDG